MTPATRDESVVADEQFRRYQRARDNGHLAFIELGNKCNRYYWGDQWDEQVKARLEAEGRPWLTINAILSTVNVMLGEQSRSRADVKFKPRGDGQAQTAETLSKVVNQITDSNHMEWVESQVFSDGVILGRGYFDVRMDFSDHIQGEVRLRAIDPYDVLLDADAREYDPKTWKEVIVTRWLSLDDIELLYGKEHAEKLRFGAGETYGSDSVQYMTGESNTFSGGQQIDYGNYTSEEERTIRRVRVIERQHRRLRKARMFVDNQTGDMREIPSTWPKDKVEQLAAKLDMSVITKLVNSVRWTVTADRHVLHDDWSPYESFTVVPYFCYFRRGKPFGVVENLISPQDQLNKVSSQELHVVNTTANSGWIFESGTLVNMSADELEAQGARTGLVLEIARGSQAPEKIKPNQIPTGLDRISMKSMSHISKISGVNESLLGYDQAEVSGVAIEAKQSRGLVQMQVPFDNLAKSRHMVAELILQLVQRYYSEERVFRVVDYKDTRRPTEEVVVNQVQEDGSVLNDLTIGEYDVIVTSAPARDTFLESQFAEALALRNVGVMIPDDAVVEYSNLEHKHELAERMRQMMGLGEPTPEEQEMAAMQQQMAMQHMQLELAELEERVNKLASETQLNQAKAAELAGKAGGEEGDAGGEQAGAQMALEMRKLAQEKELFLTELRAERDRKREELRVAMEKISKDYDAKLKQIEATKEAAKEKASAQKDAKQSGGSSANKRRGLAR